MKDKRAVPFPPYYQLDNAVVSEVTKSDSSSTLHTQKGSVKRFATNIEKNFMEHAAATTNIQLPQPAGQYIFNIQFNNVTPDVTSFFHKATYRVKLWIGVTTNALVIVAKFLESSAGPNLINQDFPGRS